ncbi:MAG: OmpA family protein, partial [Pseudomonadota bacterium]
YALNAPLAAGATVPLPGDLASFDQSPQVDYDVAVNRYPSATPVELTEISATKLDRALATHLARRDALQALGQEQSFVAQYPTLSTTHVDVALAQRASWSTTYEASVSLASLPTTSVQDLLSLRKSWGTGDGWRLAIVPLANGAEVPLPTLSTIQVASNDETGPIINQLQARPDLKLTRTSSLASRLRLKRYLAQRASYGGYPSSEGAAQFATLPTSSLEDLLAARSNWTPVSTTATEYASLTTTSVGDLIKQRSAWGSGVETSKAEQAGVYGVTQGTAAHAIACGDRISSITGNGVIKFRYASSRLDQRSFGTLSSLASVVKQCDGVVLKVEGHTDAIGAAARNQALSEKRANAVAAFLEDAGVPLERLQPIGLGETKPVAPNTTARNRALNRRIEFKVVAQ